MDPYWALTHKYLLKRISSSVIIPYIPRLTSFSPPYSGARAHTVSRNTKTHPISDTQRSHNQA